MKKWMAIAMVMSMLNSCNLFEKEFLVIGHRGAMGHETENTLASIQKAIDLGVDMIEIDVFKINSGEIVVFHDERLERLSNSRGRIEEYDISNLRQVILNGDHQIPTLQEVLQLIDNKVALNIELKGSNTAEPVNIITDHYIKEEGWALKNFVISSFKWDELKRMREQNPDISIAVLTEEDPLNAIQMARELKAVAINPYYKFLTKEKVKEIHDAGFKVYTYTVNEAVDIQRMKDFGVDGIFSNYPERVY
ncbi:glycerophosphodiester phosphodiesterase [Allomuricauda sp. SCSIO 65647]|uniref:glycerophosphodiester phosphodiesterase n=1 Tax=Allomuricauda sp. SCSIO 65647 TaxID=2908843 RepID=UPI001F438276|nr:glycerophosphodiester phosphodiesterase [Muricauda sp. SCSIO 65647]UJH66251.1 glycerophosphodiester phosphodiesterase [Muricauda sp. SCSIO 65647]